MNNIKRNDDLEIDIENKYVRNQKNTQFTTEEAIYILKRKDFIDEIEDIAIENLIKENKELKERLENRRAIDKEIEIENKSLLKEIKILKIEKLRLTIQNLENEISQVPDTTGVYYSMKISLDTAREQLQKLYNEFDGGE